MRDFWFSDGCPVAVSSRGGRAGKSLWVLYIRGYGSHSWEQTPDLLPKAPPPNAITLGSYFNIQISVYYKSGFWTVYSRCDRSNPYINYQVSHPFEESNDASASLLILKGQGECREENSIEILWVMAQPLGEIPVSLLCLTLPSGFGLTSLLSCQLFLCLHWQLKHGDFRQCLANRQEWPSSSFLEVLHGCGGFLILNPGKEV